MSEFADNDIDLELKRLQNLHRASLLLSDVIKRAKGTQQQQLIESKDKVQRGSKDIQLANIDNSQDGTHLNIVQT